MVRHGRKQCICGGPVLKRRGMKYQDEKNWRKIYDAFKWTPSKASESVTNRAS